MAVPAVGIARLAAGDFGIGLGFALGERGGLTLGGFLGGGQPGLEVPNGGLESSNGPIALGEEFAEQLLGEEGPFTQALTTDRWCQLPGFMRISGPGGQARTSTACRYTPPSASRAIVLPTTLHMASVGCPLRFDSRQGRQRVRRLPRTG